MRRFPQFVDCWTLLLAAVAGLPLGCADPSDEAPPPPSGATATLDPATVLSEKWNAAGDVDWPAVALLAQCSNIAYKDPVQAKIEFAALGFADVTPIFRVPMAAYVLADEKVVVVAFRGTDDLEDWLANLAVASRDVEFGRVHRGFYGGYESLAPPVRAELAKNPAANVWVTGHSLGGALALLALHDLAATPGATVRGAVTFGQPMALKDDAANALRDVFKKQLLRVVNNSDVVPRVPPGYLHVGSLAWFRDGQISRQPMSMAADASAPEWMGPPPLNDAEFERLQSELKRSENVDEQAPPRVATMGVMLPFVRDHAMERYLKLILDQVPKMSGDSSKQEPAPETVSQP